MNVAIRAPMTLPQFLDWEERQELRHEFDGVRPIAMTGGTFAHDQINMNLLGELRARLAGKPCRPSGPNMKVEVDGRIRYPDAFVHCAPMSPTARVVRDPVVIFEILSESNIDTDLVDKNREYRATHRCNVT